MSKVSKLIKHPILFFRDRKSNIIKREIEQTLKKESTVKNFQDKEPTVIKSIKYIFSTVINEIPVSNTSLDHYEVALYFAGDIGNIYQVEQWIATLDILNQKTKIVVITRVKEVYDWVRSNTDYIVVFCRTLESLTKVYEENNFKCILYVNHGFKNFQSLITSNALHVHINHGESDKTSTITNQSKAYDYIFIVGDAAYDKYNLNLIKKNMNHFIQVGRPQLDHIELIAPFSDDKLRIYNSLDAEEARSSKTSETKKVILYAPTWEGTHDSMNFTSLNDYGMSLVQQLINHPKYYLVYKPHPNTGSRDASCKKIHNAILKLLNNHESGEAITEGDINSLYPHIDLAIFDNSAVAIDYLQVNKPMIMTDMFHRIRDRKSKPTITKAARMLSIVDAYSISMIVSEELEKDTLKEVRNKIKHYFLGDFDYSKKESTEKFVSTILNIIDERDKLVLALKKMNEETNEIS